MNIRYYMNLTFIGSIHKANAFASSLIDLHSAEFTFTSGVTILTKAILLLSGGVLLCRNNTAMLIKNELGLSKTTGGLVSGTVPNLSPRSF